MVPGVFLETPDDGAAAVLVEDVRENAVGGFRLPAANEMFGVVVARGFAALFVDKVLEKLVGFGQVLARGEAGFEEGVLQLGVGGFFRNRFG